MFERVWTSLARVPPANPKSAIKVEKLTADGKDLKRLKSLPPINKGLRKGAENKGSKEISKDKKIKESFGFFDSQILGFDDFILSY